MGEVSLQAQKFQLSPSVGYHRQQKTESPVPTVITDHILKKKIFLIAFRKILPSTCIFIYKIITYLKNLFKSLNIKCWPAGLSPNILPYYPPIYGKPSRWGRIPPNGKKLLISLTRNISLDKFLSSVIKRAIPSPSNINFHPITLSKLHSWF